MKTLRLKAASFFITNQDNLEEALELLDNAKDDIPEEVILMEQYQFDPLEVVVSNINSLERILIEVYEQGRMDSELRYG